MQRLTLGSARQSSLPSKIGLCADDISGVANAINEAQERLALDPLTPDEGWLGGWATMRFTVQDHHGHAYVTTPRDVARLIVMDIGHRPTMIRNGFYEYLQFGTGLQPKPCGHPSHLDCTCHRERQAYERDNVFTLSDLLPTPQTVRVYPVNPLDVGKRILIQGADQNGQTITSTDSRTQQTTLGEYLILQVPFVDSINQFSSITGILKDIMLGPVTIFQVDPVSGNQVSLSSMEPQEGAAHYRRYLLDGLPKDCCSGPPGRIQVSAQARLEFIPVVSDPDYLFIQSIQALIEEVQSARFSSMDTKSSAQLAASHHTRALQFLCGQLDLHQGKVNTAVRVSIFGSQPLKYQPI